MSYTNIRLLQIRYVFHILTQVFTFDILLRIGHHLLDVEKELCLELVRIINFRTFTMNKSTYYEIEIHQLDPADTMTHDILH